MADYVPCYAPVCLNLRMEKRMSRLHEPGRLCPICHGPALAKIQKMLVQQAERFGCVRVEIIMEDADGNLHTMKLDQQQTGDPRENPVIIRD